MLVELLFLKGLPPPEKTIGEGDFLAMSFSLLRCASVFPR
jgi:hypothetical protein